MAAIVIPLEWKELDDEGGVFLALPFSKDYSDIFDVRLSDPEYDRVTDNGKILPEPPGKWCLVWWLCAENPCANTYYDTKEEAMKVAEEYLLKCIELGEEPSNWSDYRKDKEVQS